MLRTQNSPRPSAEVGWGRRRTGAGYKPAVVIESSPGNYQAVITVPKLGSRHDRDIGNRLSLLLNREFLSDNVIRILRDAYARAKDTGRLQMTQMDLLITLFTTPNSIVAECFERIGVTAARLTELAVLAERDAPAK